MQNDKQRPKTSFYNIGLSYEKADAEVRGLFSLTSEQKKALLLDAKQRGLESLIVTSTCNRTELSGFASHPFELIHLLCEHSSGSVEQFQEVASIYKNRDAVNHLFRVGTGLESQILGDFEIISQLRSSFQLSKKLQMVDTYLDRLINNIIQASKRIKNETKISSGATSVSFAAVQYIMQNVPDISNKNILLFGTGKIGRNTCENLIKHSKNSHITLINRTRSKAESLAYKFNLVVKDFENLEQELRNTDVLVVATGAEIPTITKKQLKLKKDLLVLDLSIPRNVSLDVLENNNVKLIHMDELSKQTDATLEKRKEEIPQAESILEEVKLDFMQWLDSRKFAPAIMAFKEKLQEIQKSEMNFQRKKINDFNEEQAQILTSRLIHKITTQYANHLRTNTSNADQSIDVMKSVFNIEH